MSYETMDFAISNYIDLLKKFNQKNLTISIYGGEPLLNKKNLFKIIEKYGNNHDGIEFYWIVNTNGSLLTEEDAIFLKKHNIDVHISCDGYAEIHNQNRVDKFGNGTFEKTKKALELAKKHNPKSQINSFMMPENIDNLKDLVDIAKKYNIDRIYLDLFYSKDILDSKKVVEKYFEAYSYGKKNNIKVHGPWSNILSNYLGNKKIPYSQLPSINVNVDDTFFFNMYPMTRKFKFNIKNLKKIINSKRYNVFVKSVNSYFNKKCKDCFLYNSCFGSAITQYQYHVIKKEGFEESCEFTKEIVKICSENGLLSKTNTGKEQQLIEIPNIYFELKNNSYLKSLDNKLSNYINLLKDNSIEFLKVIFKFKTVTQETIENLMIILDKFQNYHNKVNIIWEISTKKFDIENKDKLLSFKKYNVQFNFIINLNNSNFDIFPESFINFLNKEKIRFQLNYTISSKHLEITKKIIDYTPDKGIKYIALNFDFSDISNLSEIEKFSNNFFELYKICLRDGIILDGCWKNALYNYFEIDHYNKRKTPDIIINENNLLVSNFGVNKNLINKIENIFFVKSKKQAKHAIGTDKNNQPKPFLKKDCIRFVLETKDLNWNSNNKFFLESFLEIYSENNNKVDIPLDLGNIRNKIGSKYVKEYKERIKTITWTLSFFCNYNCSYCYIDKKRKLSRYSPTLDNFEILKKELSKLQGKWNIYLVGGEPLQVPGFMHIVKELVSLDFNISISSNLSADIEEYNSFFKIVRDKITFFQASFHPESVKFPDFLKKALIAKKNMDQIKRRTHIAAVGTKENINFLHNIGQYLERLGFIFVFQPQRIKYTYRKHSLIEIDLFNNFDRRFGVHNMGLKGNICRSGVDYFLLSKNGESYRCGSCVLEPKYGKLGNILDGSFSLHTEAKKCPFKKCIDITPHWGGLVEYGEK